MNDLECLGNASEFMTIESNTSPSVSPSFDEALKNFEFEYSTNSRLIKYAADETCETYNPGWLELDNTPAVPSVASQISRDFWNLQPDSIIPNQSSQSMWGISEDDLSYDQFYGAIFNSSNSNIVDHFEEFSEFSPPGNILNVELLVNPSIIGDECFNFDEQFFRTIMEPSTASNQGYLSRGEVHSIAEEIVKFSILESRPQTCPTAESDEQSKQPPTKERPAKIPSSRVENPLKSGKAPLKKMDQCKERKLPLRNGKVREQMLEELREKMEKLPAKRTATRRNAETTKIKMDGPKVDGEKKEWNKIAATRYRDKRRLTVLESEVLCGKLEKRNAFLKQQIESMELEKETIRNFMLDIWRRK